MERPGRALREIAVERNELLDFRHLAGKNDAVCREPERFRRCGRLNGALDESFSQHRLRGQKSARLHVLVHQTPEERLVERAAVHADAHRRAPLLRRLNHEGEVFFLARAFSDVSRIDAVLRERGRALRNFREELVAVVVEVADERHKDPGGVEPRADFGHRTRGFRRIHREANKFGAGGSEFRGLRIGRFHVRRGGIRHRLDDDGPPSADDHPGVLPDNFNRGGVVAAKRRRLNNRHAESLLSGNLYSSVMRLMPFLVS